MFLQTSYNKLASGELRKRRVLNYPRSIQWFIKKMYAETRVLPALQHNFKVIA